MTAPGAQRPKAGGAWADRPLPEGLRVREAQTWGEAVKLGVETNPYGGGVANELVTKVVQKLGQWLGGCGLARLSQMIARMRRAGQPNDLASAATKGAPEANAYRMAAKPPPGSGASGSSGGGPSGGSASGAGGSRAGTTGVGTPWRSIIESPGASKAIDKLSPTGRKGFDTAVEKLARGERGLNQHALGKDRAGQFAIDIPGTGKGRGAGRLIFRETKEGAVEILDVLLKHNY